MNKTPPAPVHTAKDDCTVCGKALNNCPCPWGRPFSEWPNAPLNTVRAMTHGGPHPGS